MNVILQGDGSPYGVLEVDSRSEGEFSEYDIAFLQGAANILGMAIERQRYELRLKAAVDRQQVMSGDSDGKLDFDAVEGIQLDPDRAISVALIVNELIVNELITNAVKHGLTDRPNGHIWVRLARHDENTALLAVRDTAPACRRFDLGKSQGLGMRIVAGLSKQLQAAISHRSDVDGTEFVLTVPLQRRADG